jgi:hypothetical protein
VAREQDVFQLPVRFFDYTRQEDFALAVQRCFLEIERMLRQLQMYVKQATGGAVKDLPSSAEVWNRAANINPDGTFSSEKLVGAIETLRNEIIAGRGVVTITDDDGILIVDDKDNPTKALRLLGGTLAIANEKDANGKWLWRTFGTGDGFVADEIITGVLNAAAVSVVGKDASGNPVVQIGHYETLGDQTATFSRSSVAYKQDGQQVAANVPRYEAGQFGSGILVEEGTTNLLTNPSFEGIYVSGVAPNWAAYSTGSATGSYAESANALAGSKAQRITRTGGATSDRWGIRATSSAINATNATISVYIKVLSFTPGAIVRLYGDFTGGPYGVGRSYTITSDDVGKWIRLRGSATVDSTDTCKFYVWIEGANADILVDCAQVEAKSYATSFIDGTRSPETLTIPTAGVLNPQEYTVEMWIRPSRARSAYLNYERVIEFYGTSGFSGVWLNDPSNSDGIAFVKNNASRVSANANWNANDWIFVAISQKSDGMHLWVGVAGSQLIHVSNTNTTPFNAEVTKILLGSNIYGTQSLNGLIDDLRISSRARTDEEIAAAYQSGQPLPVDEFTTYKLPFDNHLKPTVRRFGLWAKNGEISLVAPPVEGGIRVYDAQGNLRTHIGQYAPGKYGAKVINGEIYSTRVRTGSETDTAYIELMPPNGLVAYYNNKKVLELLADLWFGYLKFYDEGVDTLTIRASKTGVTIDADYPMSLFSAGDLRLEADNEVRINPRGSSDFCVVEGNIGATGLKPALHRTENYGPRTLYARESPQVRFIDESIAQLTNGECRIELNPVFLECIEPNTPSTPWLINLTPYADTSLYVAEIGDTYFVVKECGGGTSNSSFAWSLSAIRRGYAQYYLDEKDAEGDLLTSNWEDELLT